MWPFTKIRSDTEDAARTLHLVPIGQPCARLKELGVDARVWQGLQKTRIPKS